MSVLKWIKEKYTQRRSARDEHDPWWVTLMLDVGRPLIAVLILTMCAPGEHYLAMEAGWSETLAWGMPGTLTAYAGIAAVVATKRPKGAPGRTTAILGAVVSIALAMAAQPIAHLYGRQGLNPEEVWLTIIAGLIPAAVFGHLLHMGAVSKPVKVSDTKSDSPPDMSKTEVLDKAFTDSGGHGIPVSEFLSERGILSMYPGVRVSTDGQDTTPQWLADNIAESDRTGVPLSEIMSEPDSQPDSASWTAGQDIEPDMIIDELSAGQDTDIEMDNFGFGQPDVSVVNPITQAVTPVRPALSNVRPIKKATLSADVRAFMEGHPSADDADLAAAIAVKWPDKPWDSVRKARDRYQEKKRISK